MVHYANKGQPRMRIKQSIFCSLLELLRWVGAGIGIFRAYSVQENPASQLDIACLWIDDHHSTSGCCAVYHASWSVIRQFLL